MMQLQLFSITNPQTWNAALAALPYAHVLQTWEWGAFKQRTTGWAPTRLHFAHGGEVVAAASILTRSLGPLRVMDVPKGPALAYEDAALRLAVVQALEQHARQQRAIFIKIDPDVIAARGVPDEEDDRPEPLGQAFTDELARRGWRFSDEQIQFRNTVYIDLAQDEDDLLMAMKQKTRYNVRLSGRKGVTVRPADPQHDFETLFRLYEITGARDAFVTRPPAYYRDAWGSFLQSGLAHALIADYEGEPISHVILFHFGRKAWYFYGASSNQHRSVMAPYALQWEAVRWAKKENYAVYDMWGAPDVFDESDRMWGVWRFKRGFGGEVVRHIGAWDYPVNQLMYNLYTRVMPRVLAWMKRRT